MKPWPGRLLRALLTGAVFVFVMWGILHAAEPGGPDYFLRSWKTDNGLPDNTVTSIVQTRDGYLWLATYAGLARFDGVRFTIYSSANTPALQSDRLTSLFEDKQGNLWIGHERGDLTRYHEGKFESFNFHETGVRRKISAIGADEAGDIWMLNEEGTLIRVRDGASCSLPNANGLASMAQDGSGRLWVASGGKLAPLKNGSLVPLGETNDFVGYYVYGVCASRDGGLWIASDGQVRKWKDKQWVENIGTNPCTTMITAMLETESGNVALGAVSSGLYFLTPKNGELHFGRAEDFPHDWIRCLCEDREGTLWTGAGNGGLVALRPSKVKMFAPSDHWQGRVPLSTTVSHDGAVWVTTEGAGLYRLFNGEWNHFGESSGLSNQFDWCVSEDAKSRLWVGSWGNGMFVQNDGRFETPPGLENMNVPMAAILHARDGVTWIGTANGLLRYENGAVKWFGEKEGLKLPDVRAIAETPDGAIWFGTLGGGLGHLQNNVVTQIDKSHGLSSDYIQSLLATADGTLWIGTYGGGLSRLKDGHFANITSLNGLPDDFISGIAEDDRNNLWVSTRSGIFRISKKLVDDFAGGQLGSVNCQSFGKGEGMSSVECSGGFQPSVCKTADGRIWFPTSKGLAVLNPEASHTTHWLVPVVIEGMSADGVPFPEAAPLKIPPGWQNFEFRYTGLSFIDPEKIQFQQRLDGWDKNWVDAGAKRAAAYSYLPPGNYRFRVRASSGDGIWDENDTEVTFTVLPHFWQTWWFYSLTILLAVAAVTSIVWQISRRRMRRKLEAAERQQAVERERTRIAKDIHDHLGANLTRISLLSQSAHGDLENPAQAAAQLERIYSTSRELTRSMDEIVWAVNPQHDTLDSLASYLGNFAQEYVGSLGMRCRLEVPLHLPHWPITAETRHNIFLAFKEALHNVVKHSGATEVSVFLNLEATGFNLVVRDNGKGFDPAAVPERPGRGNGLKNMRQRLEKLGGHCEIHSSPGTGTEIKFFVVTPASARKSS
jgi:ligand-binding sensor domain-containing protein/signal transduction histidine kinase